MKNILKAFFALLKLLPWFIFAYFFCEINPEESYSWLGGIWQGIYSVPNWVISIAYDGRLCKAIEYNFAYSIFWWAGTILMSIYSFFFVVGFVMILSGKNLNQAQKR